MSRPIASHASSFLSLHHRFQSKVTKWHGVSNNHTLPLSSPFQLQQLQSTHDTRPPLRMMMTSRASVLLLAFQSWVDEIMEERLDGDVTPRKRAQILLFEQRLLGPPLTHGHDPSPSPPRSVGVCNNTFPDRLSFRRFYGLNDEQNSESFRPFFHLSSPGRTEIRHSRPRPGEKCFCPCPVPHPREDDGPIFLCHFDSRLLITLSTSNVGRNET